MTRFLFEGLQIRDLIERSSDAINHQDWSALEAMMTDDVVWERLPPSPWMLEGRAAVHEFLARNSGLLDILDYAVSASAVDVIDDVSAVARSTMSELIRMRVSGTAVRVVGTYRDRFARSDGRWRFIRRTITPRYEHDLEIPTRIFAASQLQPAARQDTTRSASSEP